MSDPVSALSGATAPGPVTVTEMGPRGMITVRGDLSSTTLKSTLTALSGVDFPGQGDCNCIDERGLAWMSPDEILLMCPHAEAEAETQQVTKRLADQHALAVNVSDARAVFYIQGPGVREVMAKVCPVDMHPDSFAPGQFRRTRLAQIPAAFWMRDAETVELICFRSVAQYAFDVLRTAAAEEGRLAYF